MIGLKTPIFSSYVIGQFNTPITFKVVVWIKQSHSKLKFNFRATIYASFVSFLMQIFPFFYNLTILLFSEIGNSYHQSVTGLLVQNTHQWALSFIYNTQFIGLLHKQNKGASADINLGLDKTSSVAFNSDETQNWNYYCFYFLVAIDSDEIATSVWQEEGNFEVLKVVISRFIIRLAPQAGKVNQILLLIGYPSRQDAAVLPVRDYPTCPARKISPKSI